MIGLMWWVLVGLAAGGLARLLMPGREPMGLFLTMLLGLVGSFIGGAISAAVFGYDPGRPDFHVGGLLMSTLGAVLVLAIYLRFVRQTMA